jgi:hypothetical protein
MWTVITMVLISANFVRYRDGRLEVGLPNQNPPAKDGSAKPSQF